MISNGGVFFVTSWYDNSLSSTVVTFVPLKVAQFDQTVFVFQHFTSSSNETGYL